MALKRPSWGRRRSAGGATTVLVGAVLTATTLAFVTPNWSSPNSPSSPIQRQNEAFQQGLWKAVALFNAACWGSSYVSSQAGIDALTTAGVEDAAVTFGTCRFLLAALPMLPWVLKSSCPESARGSALVGSLSAIAYAAVFASLSHGTTGAKAAFIMALQTIIVAFCSSFCAKRFQLSNFASALLALCGVGFLELGGTDVAASSGDLLCLAAPVLMGLSWHLLGEHMRTFPQDATPAVAIQLACFALVFVSWSLFEHLMAHGADGFGTMLQQLPNLLEIPNLLPALIFSAFLGNTVTFLLCNCAMRKLKAAEVSLLSASEPLWAALCASLMLHESLAPRELLGGALVVAAIIAAECWTEEELGVQGPSVRFANSPKFQRGKFGAIQSKASMS